MTEKQITDSNANDERIRELYKSAFPVEEQIPYDELISLIPKMPLDFTAYYENNEFVGFTVVYPREPFTWFWYFAVREELRGIGLGQNILTGLLKRYKGRTCILDMEAPRQPCDNREQRLRRHRFYLRNGFRDTHVYRTYENIEYTIMISGQGFFTIQDYDQIINDLRKYWQHVG
ncbi:MAG: GNAT family N-acetyltransferase [Mailhella sp.]|nr:GNAT family N-acetyltransferase [Mailhella sp.]